MNPGPRKQSPVRQALEGLTRDQVERELAAVQTEKAELESYESLLRSLLGHVPSIEGQSVVIPPKTLKEAILRVLSELPDREWRPAEMLRALQERGWAPTGPNARTQVNNRLSAMTNSGELIKYDGGGYALYADHLRSGRPQQRAFGESED